jgi:eight-cysteine-cluster-containing protein
MKKKKFRLSFIIFLFALIVGVIIGYEIGSFRQEAKPPALCLTGAEPLYKRYEAFDLEHDKECLKDDDCVISGCSLEICHTEALISTCELIPTPKNDFGCTACKCVNTRCKWVK